MDIKNQIRLKPLKNKLRHYLLSGYCVNESWRYYKEEQALNWAEWNNAVSEIGG